MIIIHLSRCILAVFKFFIELITKCLSYLFVFSVVYCAVKMIPSGPKKLQPALPANEVQEIPPPDDLKAKITFAPSIDLFFDPKEETVVLLMDLPGASKDDICIEVGDGVLSIGGPRSKSELKEKFGSQLRLIAHERPTGYYCRRFQLPSNALEDTMTAQFNAGE